MKQEETKFIKEPEEPTRQYIFQKNIKTKTGAYFIVLVLALLLLGIIASAFYFTSPL
ncbi:hypothetical protein FK220_016745 [Flavobacteriaceae bacterium TP-CH-4]|uniref:Uncharacterized protein n=1 Tax=Pelagihabitans pacificus TaxID=2696054 RepID=A0A967B0R8_9FLAO|nr:hypothetical protein [Pelagihabitans pacificus]NHF61002.1 hypothetical protein [Pelagihabitans pacificus]